MQELSATNNSSVNSANSRVIPLSALINLKDALIHELTRPIAKKASSRRRRGMLSILTVIAPQLGSLGTNLANYKLADYFRLAQFDLPGTHVWHMLSQALSHHDPSSLLSAVVAAFGRAEAGLSVQQLEQARGYKDFVAQEAENQRLQKIADNFRKEQETRARLERERQAAAQLIADKKAHLARGALLCATGNLSLADFKLLAARHVALFTEQLTLPRAAKAFGLTQENKSAITDELAEEKVVAATLRLAEKAAQATHRAWEDSLFFAKDVQALLSITPTEYARWLAEKRLKVAKMWEFKKWGKHLQAPLFDPVFLNTLTPEILAQWRQVHEAHAHLNRKASAKIGSVKTQKTLAVKKNIALDNFANEFSVARCLDREFVLCLGPTNSGKTYQAMKALTAAKSGIYLAPLRLLALENYELLKEAGVVVSLITGEERIIAPNATHVCSTIEMCDFTTAVEVAVIDEVQLLSDAQRGWGWVSAIVGAPAETVYACGAAAAEPAILELLGDTAESYITRKHQRLTPLTAQALPIEPHQVQAGDAVIAFSRHEVLNFAALFKQRGLSVSVIYGALSPEVRRRQAQMFINGETHVVVATDAIGMGLNLPIRRIVFSASAKYDGVSNRGLLTTEIQQIAGRAGRFGLHEEGFVTAFGKNDLYVITRGLSASVDSLSGPFLVMPTWLHMKKILAQLGSGSSVRSALELFQRVKFKGMYQQADLSDMLLRLDDIEGYGLPPEIVFNLANAPADPRNHSDRHMLAGYAHIISTDDMAIVPSGPMTLATPPGARYLELAEAYSRELALYSWFACKFPRYASTEGLAEQREDLAEFLNKCLLDHKSVFFKRRKKQYHWRQEFDDAEFDE